MFFRPNAAAVIRVIHLTCLAHRAAAILCEPAMFFIGTKSNELMRTRANFRNRSEFMIDNEVLR